MRGSRDCAAFAAYREDRLSDEICCEAKQNREALPHDLALGRREGDVDAAHLGRRQSALALERDLTGSVRLLVGVILVWRRDYGTGQFVINVGQQRRISSLVCFKPVVELVIPCFEIKPYGRIVCTFQDDPEETARAWTVHEHGKAAVLVGHD